MLVHGIIPYCRGPVTFRGAAYDGLHEPLVSKEIWYRVQAILTDHHLSREKTQAHDHYLKGSIFCGECGSRLILSNAHGSQDVISPYFLCLGRHSKRTNCERSARYVPDIETAVEEYYRIIEIPGHTVVALRELVVSEFDQPHGIARRERHAYESERADLLDERSKLLQAHYHYPGAIPIDLLKTEQERISRRLAFLEVQIEAGDMEYDQAKAHLDDCLALAGNCHKLYMSLDDSLRRTCNQAFFDKLYVMPDDRIEGQIGEPFSIFFDPGVQKLALRRKAEGESGTQTSSVARLNNDLLVGLTGAVAGPLGLLLPNPAGPIRTNGRGPARESGARAIFGGGGFVPGAPGPPHHGRPPQRP
ncbi:MAG: recombinase zinc beta ribbon domain-containing protein, partial [Pseudoclavibacter sp.]